MALGGGTFSAQNKVLPGTYINMVSTASSSTTISDRGVAALGLGLSWGPDDEVFSVDNSDFLTDCKTIFGYAYDDDAMKGLRDLFDNAQTVYFYKLMNAGVAASNTYATAKYKGQRGNDLKIVIAANADDESAFDVSTYLDSTEIESQTVASAADLVDNDFVTWITDASLEETAGLSLSSGSDGDDLSGDQYQAALDAFEAYSFNTLGCLSTSDTIKDLYVEYTKRMRDEVGSKFQTVLYQVADADYEGIISVDNEAVGTSEEAGGMVYWTLGAQANCAVNKSLTNTSYSGEFTPDTSYKQSALEDGVEDGKFLFHKVDDDIRVLTDINTFVSVTDDKSEDFSSNQTVRVLDQVANDIGTMFSERYLGKIPNDADGRVSLWNAIVKHHQALATSRAIEDFSSDDVTVEAGDTKTSVVVTDNITPVNAMEKLYMTVIVE